MNKNSYMSYMVWIEPYKTYKIHIKNSIRALVPSESGICGHLYPRTRSRHLSQKSL